MCYTDALEFHHRGGLGFHGRPKISVFLSAEASTGCDFWETTLTCRVDVGTMFCVACVKIYRSDIGATSERSVGGVFVVGQKIRLVFGINQVDSYDFFQPYKKCSNRAYKVCRLHLL